MASHLALLRGINVGRAKRVPMAELRSELEAEGFGSVSTLLATGNVLFDPPAGVSGDLAEVIHGLVERAFDVDSWVLVLSAAELERVAEEFPWPDRDLDPSRVQVAFYGPGADASALEELADRDWQPERLVVGSLCAFASCPDGVRDSSLLSAIGRALDDRVTTRNWRTVGKLRDRLSR